MLLEGEKWVLERWVDGIIAVSEAAAKELSTVDLPKHVIPGGVDCEHWHPDPVARERIRSFLGYQKDDIVVGVLSRMVPSKGWMSLPKIAARVVRLLPKARFLAIGDGPLRLQLERQIEELNIRNFVITLGFRPWWETPEYLNAMDIFVFPSYIEACGLALLEAMACAKAVVARANAGSREAITDGETGYLIASDEELFQKLIMLAQDKELRDRIGANARSYVQGRYSWKVTTQRTIEAYGEMIRRRTERNT
jgi:glycosyltransferase involved in cell wall biosynthesis